VILECAWLWIGDWWIDLLTNYTHNSDLQVITVPSLISTQITTAPARPSPACSVSDSCSLARASNTGDFSASRTQVLSSQLPMQNSCQLSSEAWCQLLASLAELNWLVSPILFFITTLHGPNKNTVSNNNCTVAEACLPICCLEMGYIILFCCCMHVCCGHYPATVAVYRVTA
jgi:hypothetical protein